MSPHRRMDKPFVTDTYNEILLSNKKEELLKYKNREKIDNMLSKRIQTLYSSRQKMLESTKAENMSAVACLGQGNLEDHERWTVKGKVKFIFCIFMQCAYLCISQIDTQRWTVCGGERASHRSWFFPPTVWMPGVNHPWSGLAACSSTYFVFTLAQRVWLLSSTWFYKNTPTPKMYQIVYFKHVL